MPGREYRDAAQEKLPGEQVEAAWLFYRTGGYAGLALGPPFLLALTPGRLYAFKCKPSAREAKVGSELAVWDRAGLQIGIRDAAVPAPA